VALQGLKVLDMVANEQNLVKLNPLSSSPNRPKE
jgi:hypothetical protein